MRAVGVMDFAGSFALGVQQAGFDYIAKREPSAFKGFGVAAIEMNMKNVQIEVTEPEFWSMVRSEMVFGCPPCSGFSMLSTINTADSKTGKVVDGVRVSQRGIDSPDNVWLWELIDYASKTKPEAVVIESVPSGGKLGAPLMRTLWQRLRDQSGIDYHLTDVFMNASLIGGDVIRPRYFFVAHRQPFGVELPTAKPLALKDVIGDLGPEDFSDPDWGHHTTGSAEDIRIRKTIELFREHNYDWAQGKRLPEHMKYWYEEMEQEVPAWWFNKDGKMLSHAYSDNMYSPFRWRSDQPMGVVTGGFLDRAVHPTEPRLFTYREGARFMGLPDDWSLRPIVEGRKGMWLGKAIPVASGRWISTWVMNAIEGTPGEYAGFPVEPKHRMIDVTTSDKVHLITRNVREDVWWDSTPTHQYSYAAIGRNGPPAARGQHKTSRISSQEQIPTAALPKQRTKPRVFNKSAERQRGRPHIVATRISPEEVSAELLRLGLTKRQAAEALGVSVSRVAELTGHTRPGSWLNADRWDEVKQLFAEYVAML